MTILTNRGHAAGVICLASSRQVEIFKNTMTRLASSLFFFSVRIYGAFDVLASSAVTLVDVPGFGDANKTRFDQWCKHFQDSSH
jgi:hypothetical protein